MIPYHIFLLTFSGNCHDIKTFYKDNQCCGSTHQLSSYPAFCESPIEEVKCHMTRLQKNIDDIGQAIDAYQPENLNTLDDVRDSDIQDTIDLLKSRFIDNPVDTTGLGVIQSDFGMVVAVDTQGNMKKAITGQGTSWKGTTIPVDENTLQPVLSMGKLILGLTIGAMVDRGAIYPQMRIHDILPSWKPGVTNIKVLRNVRRIANDNVVCDGLNGTVITLVEDGVVVDKAAVADKLEPLTKGVRVHDLMTHSAGFVGTLFTPATGELSIDASLTLNNNNPMSMAQAVLEYPDKIGIMGFQPGESWAYDASHFVLTGFIEIIYNLRLNPNGPITDPNHPDFRLFDELFQDLVGSKMGLSLGDDYFISVYPRNSSLAVPVNESNVLGWKLPQNLFLTGNSSLAQQKRGMYEGREVQYAFTSQLPASGLFDIEPNGLAIIVTPDPKFWSGLPASFGGLEGKLPMMRGPSGTAYFKVTAYTKLFQLIMNRGMHEGKRIICERWMFIMEQPNLPTQTDMSNTLWSVAQNQANTYGYGLGSPRQYANSIDSSTSGLLLPGEMVESGLSGLRGMQIGDSIIFVSIMALTYGQTYVTRPNGDNEFTVDEFMESRQVMYPVLDTCAAVFIKNAITVQRKRTLYSAQSVMPSI